MNFTLLITFLIGFFIGILVMLFFQKRTEKRLKEYQRKLEKTSINSTEESSKVTVLEAKIATLEKALQSALDKE